MGKRGPVAWSPDWNEFYKLVSYQCTQIEVADFFGVSLDTLENACKRELGQKLSEIWLKKKSLGKIRLRKAQFDGVESLAPGWATMAIYLDKKIFPDERFSDVPPAAPATLGTGTRTRKSFAEFCVASSYPAPYPKQIEMSEFGLKETAPRLLLGARGYGKTDYGPILSIAYELYCAWFDNNSETSNLIVTKTKERGSAFLNEISVSLTLNGVELEKDNASCIRIKGHRGKDHSVSVISIKTSFRGRHPDRIWFDDPVTEEDVSAAMRKLVLRKYREAYKLCENIVIIGQPAHNDDLYAHLKPLLKTMEVPYGSIPELDVDLDAMRAAGIDEASIQMSYFLVVPKEGQSIFCNLKYVDEFPVGDSVAFLDPSDGKNFTAMSSARGYLEGIAVAGKAWKRPWFLCLDQVVEECRRRRVKKLWFETNKHGEDPVNQLREAFKLANLPVSVEGHFSTTNKHASIESAGAYSHMIHLSKTSDTAYTEQVVKYELGVEADDSPDSMARLLQCLGLLKGKR